MSSLARLAAGCPRVFPSHPRAEGYYPSERAEEARARLVRCLQRGEGPALLIGAPGVGKSSLLAVIKAQLAPNFHVASLTSVQLCTRRALLQSILFSLGQPYRQREEGELRIALLDYLTNSPESKNGTVLLVDEAQALPQRLLEELRMLSNIAPGGESSVRLLLAGGPRLEEMFATPEHEAFNQRIAARCYLSPLSHTDTVKYVRSHLATAHGNAERLITTDALDAIYNATDGIPRLINQLCDRALVMATDAGYLQLERAAIETAWADLQQLPTPWDLPSDMPEIGGEANVDETQGIVEFGPLSDDNGDLAAPQIEPEASIAIVTDEQLGDLNDTVEYEPHEAISWSVTPEPDESPTTDEPFLQSTIESDSTVELSTEVPALEELLARAEANYMAAANSEPAPTITPVTTTPSATAANPFDDQFEEEELVINSFASVATMVSDAAPRVDNQFDQGETSRLLAGVVESPETAQSIDEPVPETDSLSASHSLSVFGAPIEPDEASLESPCCKGLGDACQQECQLVDEDQVAESHNEVEEETATIPDPMESETTNQVELLVVDNDDTPLQDSDIATVDYRQLFAKLNKN